MIYSSGTHTKNMVVVQQEAIVNPFEKISRSDLHDSPPMYFNFYIFN